MIAWIRGWSISRRLFALQFVFVLALTGAALVWLYNDARGIVEQSAADHSLSVATSIADNPFVLEALQAAGPDAAGSAGSGVAGADASIALEPYAQDLMTDTATDFITIMAPDRTRFTHPNPAEIGRPFVGNIEPALLGRPFTETYTGTLGPSVRAVVPILNPQGNVIALVAAGVTVSKVSGALAERLPLVFGFAGLTLLFGALASWLLSRYLRRVTWGRGPEELGRMFLYYEGVLHSVREGLVLVDARGRLVLHNDRAAELLGLPPSGGAPVAVSELQVPDALRSLLAGGARAVDEIFVTEDRVLVVNQEPAVSAPAGAARGPRGGAGGVGRGWPGSPRGVAEASGVTRGAPGVESPGRRGAGAAGARRVMGTVTTLRDHTDLLRISGELQNMRTLSDALRSQTHEHANRLHTIVALIELGRHDEAIALAAGELDHGQELADQLIDAVEEPVLAALLVGKSAEARERGIVLTLDVDPALGAIGVPADDLITIVGNLVDNALDAAAPVATPPAATAATAATTTAIHESTLLGRSVQNTAEDVRRSVDSHAGGAAVAGAPAATAPAAATTAAAPVATAASVAAGPPVAVIAATADGSTLRGRSVHNSAEDVRRSVDSWTGGAAVAGAPAGFATSTPAASAASAGVTTAAHESTLLGRSVQNSAEEVRIGVGSYAGAGGGARGAGRVAVSVGCGEGGSVIIRVADSGAGIPDVERAFERGYSSKPAGPHGRGIGLALVGQSVRRLGGTIAVAADGGAVVTVTLPRTFEAGAADRADPGGAAGGAAASGGTAAAGDAAAAGTTAPGGVAAEVLDGRDRRDPRGAEPW